MRREGTKKRQISEKMRTKIRGEAKKGQKRSKSRQEAIAERGGASQWTEISGL